MRRLVVWAMVIGFGSVATGCVMAPPRPSVYAYPAKGQSAEQMSRDQAECQVWAKQQTGFDPAVATAKGAGLGAVIGAAGGAAAGAAIGAAAGNAGKGAAVGAAAGGIGGAGIGGTVGYSKNKQGYDRAYAACMSARGYAVTSQGATPKQTAVITPAPAPPPVVGAPPTSHTLYAEEIKAGQVRANTIYANEIKARHIRGQIYQMGKFDGQNWGGEIKAPVVSASVIYADEIKANSVEANTIYVHKLKVKGWKRKAKGWRHDD